MEENIKQPKPIMEDENEEDNYLQDKFRSLEQDWDMMKQQSNPQTFKSIQMLNSSPKSLMSSLQLENSISPFENTMGSGWNVRTNELAVVEEIKRERKAALERGEFGGRKLFDQVSSEEAVDIDDICSDCCDDYWMIHDSEIKTVTSSSSSYGSNYYSSDGENNVREFLNECSYCNSCLAPLSFEEASEKVKQAVVVESESETETESTMEEETRWGVGTGGRGERKQRPWMTFMAGFLFAWVVFAMMWMFDGNGLQHESVFPLPT